MKKGGVEIKRSERARLQTSGTLFKVSVSTPFIENQKSGGGIKREIQGFTAKARLNFGRVLASTSWPENPVHISLTYGQLETEDAGTYWKDDMKQLGKWLLKRGIYGYWRLEFQERRQVCVDLLEKCAAIGERQMDYLRRFRRAAHFHLLVTWLSEEQERELIRYWSQRTGNNSKYAVKVTRRESARASWYLALHAQKGNQAPNIKVGRWWGYIGERQMKSLQHLHDHGEISEKTEYKIIRILRKFRRQRRAYSRRQSMTVFMSEHTQERLMEYLVRDVYTEEERAAREADREAAMQRLAVALSGPTPQG